MNRPAKLLPDDTQESKKARPPASQKRGASCALIMATLLLSLTLVTITAIIVFQPGYIGLEVPENAQATRGSLQGTADALDGIAGALQTTSIALEGTAQFNAGQAFANESTLAGLENRQAVLEQQETQSGLDVIATQTGIALSNAQQATQNALEFQGTQAAFDRSATQVELDYQGTQAALNQNATAVALGFATQAPPAEDVLTQTPQATFTAVPLLEDGFVGGVGASLWQFGASDWRLSGESTLEATRSGAWLLTQVNTLTGYILNVDLIPLAGQGLAADYFILLNVQGDTEAPGGMAVRLSYDGERLTAVGLFRFTRGQMLDEFGLLDASLEAIQAVQVNAAPDAELNVKVEVRQNRVIVIAEGGLLLDVTLDALPPAGAVGLQVPVSTQVKYVSLAL